MLDKIIVGILIIFVCLIMIKGCVLNALKCAHISLGDSIPSTECDPERQKQMKISKEMSHVFMEKHSSFQCRAEIKPKIQAQIDQIYQYAYYQELKNQDSEDPKVWNEIARYYRIAAEYGDYRANERLQSLIKLEKISIDQMSQAEALKTLIDRLAQDLPARAKYLHYLSNTAPDPKYQLLPDAALLGDADAQQYFSGNLLGFQEDETITKRMKLFDQVRLCASKNGNWTATNGLEDETNSQILYADKENPALLAQSLAYKQLALKQGDAAMAITLADAFNLTKPETEQDQFDYKEKYLGVENDLERSQRYIKINEILNNTPYQGEEIVLSDLDEIVPLPPKKLPKWDGKLAIQRWYEDQTHEKPSEILIMKLAQEKGLDPKTGKPVVVLQSVKKSQ